jgi:uncharacterized protein DUF6279
VFPDHFIIHICRLLKCSLLGSVILSSSACSTSFAYNHLDKLIPWYLNDYVDLDREQKQLLKARLVPVLDWHRSEELQRYIAILDKIENDLAGRIDAAVVQSWLEDFVAAADRLQLSAVDTALQLGETMSDEQLRDFITRLWERQAELEQEYLQRNAEQYSKESYQSIEKNLRRFSGHLTTAQKQRLRQASDSLLRFDTVWLADRQQWLQKLELLLERKAGWQTAIMTTHIQRAQNRTSEYQNIMEQNINTITVAIAEILMQFDQKQETRMKKKIRNLRKDIYELMERNQAASVH